MHKEQIVEVCTPALSFAANTDSSVEPVITLCDDRTGSDCRYLHTSPEFAMKRILAAYPHADIYQIAMVFREEEQGRFHTSQFSLLEWYRLGLDHHGLIQDVKDLLCYVYASLQLDKPAFEICSYGEAVRSHLGQWPDELEPSQVQSYFRSCQRSFPTGISEDMDACLDLFIDEFVLPEFSQEGFTILTDYPSSQAALARLGANEYGRTVAERFELFFGRVELANGFHELSDADEQSARFNDDLHKRSSQRKRLLPVDENLLAALAHGLPDCAGIALGLERLLMVIGKHEHISEVLSFDDHDA